MRPGRFVGSADQSALATTAPFQGASCLIFGAGVGESASAGGKGSRVEGVDGGVKSISEAPALEFRAVSLTGPRSVRRAAVVPVLAGPRELPETDPSESDMDSLAARLNPALGRRLNEVLERKPFFGVEGKGARRSEAVSEDGAAGGGGDGWVDRWSPAPTMDAEGVRLPKPSPS